MVCRRIVVCSLFIFLILPRGALHNMNIKMLYLIIPHHAHEQQHNRAAVRMRVLLPWRPRGGQMWINKQYICDFSTKRQEFYTQNIRPWSWLDIPSISTRISNDTRLEPQLLLASCRFASCRVRQWKMTMSPISYGDSGERNARLFELASFR